MSSFLRSGITGLCLALGACGPRYVDPYPESVHKEKEEIRWADWYDAASSTKLLMCSIDENRIYCVNALGVGLEKITNWRWNAKLSPDGTSCAVQDKPGYSQISVLSLGKKSETKVTDQGILLGWNSAGNLIFQEKYELTNHDTLKGKTRTEGLIYKIDCGNLEKPDRRSISSVDKGWTAALCDDNVLLWPRELPWRSDAILGKFTGTSVFATAAQSIVKDRLPPADLVIYNTIDRKPSTYNLRYPASLDRPGRPSGMEEETLLEWAAFKDSILAFVERKPGDKVARLRVIDINQVKDRFIGKSAEVVAEFNMPEYSWTHPNPPQAMLAIDPRNSSILCTGVVRENEGLKNVLFTAGWPSGRESQFKIDSAGFICNPHWIADGAVILYQEKGDLSMVSRYGRRKVTVRLPGLEGKVGWLYDVRHILR